MVDVTHPGYRTLLKIVYNYTAICVNKDPQKLCTYACPIHIILITTVVIIIIIVLVVVIVKHLDMLNRVIYVWINIPNQLLTYIHNVILLVFILTVNNCKP